MSGSQRHRAAHKGTGRQTNDTGRRTKGIEGNRNELNAVHIQLWCRNKNRLFSHGLGQKYNTSFNTDIMLRREKVLEDDYYTHLFTVECMDTGYTVAKYINKYKYEDKYEMINDVVLNLWVYGVKFYRSVKFL